MIQVCTIVCCAIFLSSSSSGVETLTTANNVEGTADMVIIRAAKNNKLQESEMKITRVLQGAANRIRNSGCSKELFTDEPVTALEHYRSRRFYVTQRCQKRKAIVEDGLVRQVTTNE